MKNLSEYNKFVQSLEQKAGNGLFFHRINNNIYITNFSHKLLGIWGVESGESLNYKDILAGNPESAAQPKTS